jgi:hypothetical protein
MFNTALFFCHPDGFNSALIQLSACKKIQIFFFGDVLKLSLVGCPKVKKYI